MIAYHHTISYHSTLQSHSENRKTQLNALVSADTALETQSTLTRPSPGLTLGKWTSSKHAHWLMTGSVAERIVLSQMPFKTLTWNCGSSIINQVYLKLA